MVTGAGIAGGPIQSVSCSLVSPESSSGRAVLGLLSLPVRLLAHSFLLMFFVFGIFFTPPVEFSIKDHQRILPRIRLPAVSVSAKILADVSFSRGSELRREP